MIDQSAERRLASNDIIMRLLLYFTHCSVGSDDLMFNSRAGPDWDRLNTADYPGNINNGGDSRGDTAVITIT